MITVHIPVSEDFWPLATTAEEAQQLSEMSLEFLREKAQSSHLGHYISNRLSNTKKPTEVAYTTTSEMTGISVTYTDDNLNWGGTVRIQEQVHFWISLMSLETQEQALKAIRDAHVVDEEPPAPTGLLDVPDLWQLKREAPEAKPVRRYVRKRSAPTAAPSAFTLPDELL